MTDEDQENHPGDMDPPRFDEPGDEPPEDGDGARPAILAPASDRRSSGHIWLISYADFMTILMIFFLVMYGYAYITKNQLQPESTITYSEFSRKMAALKKDIGAEIDVTETFEKVTIEMEDDVLFGSGSAQLTDRAREAVEEMAKSIKLVEGRVIVEGHTDNVPVRRGPYRSNWELSAARAFSVIDALVKTGVEESRLAAWGFGENRPVASNDKENGRKRNRRIAIVLLKSEQQAS